jgi:hypothetical protein
MCTFQQKYTSQVSYIKYLKPSMIRYTLSLTNITFFNIIVKFNKIIKFHHIYK